MATNAMRGTCPVCRRDVGLFRNGTTRPHAADIWVKDGPKCKGGGEPAIDQQAGT